MTVNSLLRRVKQKLTKSKSRKGWLGQRQSDIEAYLKGGRKPWSRGYKASKFDFIQTALKDDALVEKFRCAELLPKGYGYGYDERVVEYPWVLPRLSEGKSKLLDAGSAFNFPEIIESPKLAGKDITIFTLAPESKAFWEKGISYHYGDLREMPFKDGWFDEVVSISTLEHVGMNNRMYTGENSSERIVLEAKQAARELIRVLRAGGKFLASVEFGKRQLIEWDGAPFAEQFDSLLLEDLLTVFSSCGSVLKSFYKYTGDGWNLSTEQDCQGVKYFNIHTAKSYDSDNAAAARAVVLIEVIK
ncbi:MAG: methyltransferase domain-containing protein [Sedimentisphaerales bacterium]|nr:methyltransferase domain-containing protein [Sedimentisphaerales bacterium]